MPKKSEPATKRETNAKGEKADMTKKANQASAEKKEDAKEAKGAPFGGKKAPPFQKKK